ncbi:EboA domain-containing protein [Streptomyces sp. SYSU K21746]
MLTDLHSALDKRLGQAARAWLAGALAEADAGLPGWELRFAEAGRQCGADHAAADDARVLLLRTAAADGTTTARLYRHGTAAERRAVLRALPYLTRLTPADGVPLVEDALRTNDTRLVTAAVGPYAAAHLAPHAWRHAILKCLFTGVPLDAVAGLAARARGDAELARMLTDYASERTAAGRDVPADLHRAHALALARTQES